MPALGSAGRPVLLLIRSLQWISSVIAMGIFSYLIHKNHHGAHLIYNEVIAVLSVVFFIPAFISPFMPTMLSKFVVLIDLVFSYLWLTAFIFTAEDFDRGFCYIAEAPGVSCSKKHAAQAFTFLAFIFTFFGLGVETFSRWVDNPEPVSTREKNGARAPLDAPVQSA
ncbi:hypothetical protein BGW36DRAFT_307305 [Talaromyces proteolyticus]|uniref:MARVEL domain-containing protein n=1 Tax=Talaromyces proteolyticus TaxID=1131652 RepID=A0AAD4KJI9_9EURO|nr:uncharacterized protein BGW36DRAFT_307305 [Talaromyces proteolyticus]KAH8689971.1 hypothetical protein BGW36DRAFT_307305 [Talaromyces proteolyticus]